MRDVRIHAVGGPEVLCLKEVPMDVPMDVPGPGELKEIDWDSVYASSPHGYIDYPALERIVA
ncbi:hypothetical protein ACFONN_15135 [Dyella humi]|uniref:Uncharacterized protein n=1 Tax=Dyella humi TaxID=1770547 RepID=A0ABW8INU0_9GAMM